MAVDPPAGIRRHRLACSSLAVSSPFAVQPLRETALLLECGGLRRQPPVVITRIVNQFVLAKLVLPIPRHSFTLLPNGAHNAPAIDATHQRRGLLLVAVDGVVS